MIKSEYKITILYLIIGGLWILFSDRLVSGIASNAEDISILQTWKGWFYVAVTGLLLFFLIRKDNQNLRKSTNALQKAKDELEKANRIKSSFLTNMSHEVRTPMNAIIGFSELLKTETLSKKQRAEYLDFIQQNSNQLVDLITNISDVSDLQVNHAEIITSRFCLNDLIDELQQEAESLLPDNKKTSITIESFKNLARIDSYIEADFGKLSRMLYHLLSNAIKYTNEGKIEFGYELLNEEEIRFFVRDTGIGIAKEDQENIFTSFVRSEKETTIRGAGLGLAVVKGFVEKMDGEIQLNSKIGSGTVFYITLPYHKIVHIT